MVELEVVTPHRLLFREQCESVTIPGGEGQFEVLEGHTPFLATVKTGILSFRRAKSVNGQKQEMRLMVGPGFAEVSDRSVSVLCDVAVLPEEVDARSEQDFINKVQAQLKELGDKNVRDFKHLQAELETASVKLQLL